MVIKWSVAGLMLLLACEPTRHERRSATQESARSRSVTGQLPPDSQNGAVHSTSHGCLEVWPSTVQLAGILRAEERLGPPGYGESPEQDERITIYLLVLDEAEDVCAESGGNQSPLKTDVRNLQLTGNLDLGVLRRNIGGHVLIYGSLFHRSWGTDFTDVVLRAESLRVLKPSPGRST